MPGQRNRICFGGSFDFGFLDDPVDFTGAGSATDEQPGFPPKPPQLPFMHDEPDSRLKFVDKGSGPSHDQPTKFEKVATSVPSHGGLSSRQTH